MVEQTLLMLGMAHQMIQSLSLLYVLIDREILNMQNFPQLQHLKILPRFSSNIIDYRLERSRSYLFSSEFVFGLQGSSIVNLLHLPTVLITSIFPPILFTIFFTIESPRPVL